MFLVYPLTRGNVPSNLKMFNDDMEGKMMEVSGFKLTE